MSARRTLGLNLRPAVGFVSHIGSAADRRVEFEVGFVRAIVVQIGAECCGAFRGKWSPSSGLSTRSIPPPSLKCAIR